MSNRKIKKYINPIAIIDDLIFELSYMKSGDESSNEKLQNGVDLIDFLIKISDAPEEEINEDKWGIIPLKEKKNSSFNETQIIEFKEQLKEVSELIKTSIKTPTLLSKEKIDKTQEILLKISLPIWKSQIGEYRLNKFKKVLI